MTDSLSTHPSFTAGTWRLDGAHSELGFSVRHLAISKVKGTFDRFDATVTAAADGTVSVEATIEVASINTRNEGRDGHLQSGDFFKTDEFPAATFTSTSVTAEGDELTVAGELTLRGVTKPVTLKGELGGIVVDGYGNTKAGVTATTQLNRQDFGVSWNAALEAGGLTLGDEVTLTLEAEFALDK